MAAEKKQPSVTTPLSHLVTPVTLRRGLSPLEHQVLVWMQQQPPYVFDAQSLVAGLKFSPTHARKLLERLTSKGRLKRYAYGRYELMEKPLAAFLPEPVTVGGTVHRVLVEGSMPVFRVNGLQGYVSLGEVGVAFFRRLEREVR